MAKARIFTLPVTEIRRGDQLVTSLEGGEIRKVASTKRGTWPGSSDPAVLVTFPDGCGQAFFLDQRVHVIRNVEACQMCFRLPATVRRTIEERSVAVCTACTTRPLITLHKGPPGVCGCGKPGCARLPRAPLS
jgi:hypothetical protein